MKMNRPLIALLAASVLAGSVSAAAYIKFDGVDGESTDADHKDWINIQSLSSGIQRPRSDSTGGLGPAFASDIIVVKQLDKSSPKLAESVAKGTVFPSVQFHLTRRVGTEREATYYTYELKNVIVTSYQVGGSGSASESRPTETLSLNFEEIKVTYVPAFDGNGRPVDPVETVWKVDTGTAGGTN